MKFFLLFLGLLMPMHICVAGYAGKTVIHSLQPEQFTFTPAADVDVSGGQLVKRKTSVTQRAYLAGSEDLLTVGDIDVRFALKADAGGVEFFMRRGSPASGSFADSYYGVCLGYINGRPELHVHKRQHGKIVGTVSMEVQQAKSFETRITLTGYEMNVQCNGKQLSWRDDEKTGRKYNHGWCGFVFSGEAAQVSSFSMEYTRAGIASIAELADFIMRAGRDDGSIANYPEGTFLSGYQSHFGALGLVRAYELTGDKRYLETAKKWADWYREHMDGNGFTFDCNFKPGGWVSTGDMDSTDSYAALYLMLLEEIYNVTGDAAFLAGYKKATRLAVNAITATMEPDGLTWAKPAYKAKFLMDNVETRAGLISAEKITGINGDTELNRKLKGLIENNGNGIESMWNEGLCAYANAKNERSLEQCKWEMFYADGVAQPWAVAFGIGSLDRSAAILKKFESLHPDWDRPESSDLFPTSDGPKPQPVGYVPVVGWAYQRLGDFGRAQKAAERILAAAANKKYGWPFNTIVAGECIILLSGGYAVGDAPSAGDRLTPERAEMPEGKKGAPAPAQ